MTEIDEYNEACEVALRLANQGLTAEEITSELNGVCGFETGPNDWHDCDLCDATGKIRSND